MTMDEVPKEIEVNGKKYPVTSVTLDRRGNLRELTIQGIPDLTKKVPVYPYRIERKL